jgi:uncharacterized membrane protein YoaK (UPF0700 family)
MLLSFNAGHLNGVTILQDHPTTTTHMTGNATYLGISIALLNYRKMFFYTSLIFSYILGSFISGLMIPYQSFSISLGYGKVFILVSILLSISALIDIYHTSDYIFYDLLVACASGLQNGMVSRSDTSFLFDDSHTIPFQIQREYSPDWSCYWSLHRYWSQCW